MFDIARESEIAVYLDDAWKFPTRPAVRDLKAGGRVALALWYQYYKQLDDAYDWCLHAYWTVAPEIQTAGCFGEDRMLDTTEVATPPLLTAFNTGASIASNINNTNAMSSNVGLCRSTYAVDVNEVIKKSAENTDMQAEPATIEASATGRMSSTAMMWCALLVREVRDVVKAVREVEVTSQEDGDAKAELIKKASSLRAEVAAALPEIVHGVCRHGRPAPVVFSTTEHPLTQAKALVAVSSAVADIMLRAPRRAAPAAPAPHSAAAAAGAAIAARPLRAELMQHARRIGEAVEKEEKLFNGLYTLVGSTTTPTAARRIPQPFLDELESLHELWEKITHRYADCYVLLESTKLATLTGRAQHIMRELIDVMEMVIETRRRAKGLFEYVTATGDNPGK